MYLSLEQDLKIFNSGQKNKKYYYKEKEITGLKEIFKICYENNLCLENFSLFEFISYTDIFFNIFFSIVFCVVNILSIIMVLALVYFYYLIIIAFMGIKK
jgi:hypothetical protein